MNYRTNNSEEIGKIAVEKFIKLANQYNFDVVMATADQDRLEHWDLEIKNNESNFSRKVEVKSLKRINRWDNNQQSSWICIEFQGISGYPGWLYGKADIIAFETEAGFLLINRNKLVEVAEKKINKTQEPQQSPRNGKKLYTMYRRFGRNDRFAFIDRSSIQFLDETITWSEDEQSNKKTEQCWIGRSPFRKP